METMPRRVRRPIPTFALVLLSIAPFYSSSCREESNEPELFTLEGRVQRVDITGPNTGRLTVAYASARDGQETVGVGEVTPETEIMINGVVAPLDQIQVGERLRGEVRIEKAGDSRRQTIVRINVDRAQPLEAAEPGTG